LKTLINLKDQKMIIVELNALCTKLGGKVFRGGYYEYNLVLQSWLSEKQTRMVPAGGSLSRR
jgi:hypothetical protein